MSLNNTLGFFNFFFFFFFQCLKKWGFRRCEDICWIKTNKANPGNTKYLEPDAIFQHTKEHCLMGIKGTVRRSTDGDFIHANVDIDLIITEEVNMTKYLSCSLHEVTGRVG